MAKNRMGDRPAKDKDIRDLLAHLNDQGARVETTRRGWMVYPPDKTKQPITIHGTNSDPRSINNTRARVRQAGLTCPGDTTK